MIEENLKSEEVQDLIDRMPTKFGTAVTILVSIIFTFICFFGWFVKYPDTIEGDITINSTSAPVKLVANSSGKLILLKDSSGEVANINEYIAYVENPASIKDVEKLTHLVRSVSPSDLVSSPHLNDFTNNLSLGDLNVEYFAFINSKDAFLNNRRHNLFQQQQVQIIKDLKANKVNKALFNEKLHLLANNVVLEKKMFIRDSSLFLKKFESAAEFEKSKIAFYSAQNEYQSLLKESNENDQQMDDLQSKLEQLGIQGNEKDRQNQLDLITAYNNLLDKLSDWELKYVFKAPKKGKVQFLKFWETNQFVQAGEAVFNIVPDKAVIIGQMHLPTKGVGKVKIGQDVIIKLDNYPYMEYGSITGKVSSVSLTSDFEKSASGSSVDLYLVNITLPNQLKTNYGPKLEFKFEIKGTADIVTNDRRLIQRLFDNLKYAVRQ